MPTLNELTADTIRQLYGYAQIKPRQVSLAGDITATDTDIKLTGEPGGSRSVVEIGDEIVYIRAYDRATGTASCDLWGRGYDGTSAQPHAAGDMVTMDPQWTIKNVRDELATQIRMCYPELWASRAVSAVMPVAGIGIPVIGRVTDVFTDDAGETPRRVAGFDVSEGALYVRGASPGTALRVYYAAPPDVPLPDEDVCLSSGLPAGSEQVLQLGAMAKFIGGVSAALTQSNDVEQSDRATTVSLSSTTTLSRLLLQQRLLEVQRVRDSMFESRPLRPHRI